MIVIIIISGTFEAWGLTDDCLHSMLQAGYIFRLRLLCTPEVTLLKKQIQDGVTRYKNTTSSVALQLQLMHLPLLHSALHG